MGGAAIQPNIRLNDEIVGKSVPGGFFFVDRPPGDYEVRCATEVKRTMTFTLAAGEKRYVRTKVVFGVLAGRVYPILEDEDQALETLTKSSYIGDKPL